MDSHAPTAAPADTIDAVVDRLRGIWRNVLNVAEIGPDDNFLALGGDSVAATLCVMEIQRACNVEVPATELLFTESSTLRLLAAQIHDLQDRALSA